VELLQRIEKVLNKKMDEYQTEAEDIAAMKERVEEAARLARAEIKDSDQNGKSKGKRRRNDEGGGKDDRDRDDDVVEAGMPRMNKKFRKNK